MSHDPVQTTLPDDRGAFWDNFYANGSHSWALSLPSQFAAFVANEIHRQAHVIDIGCGNARDSFFFARHGFQVTGLDASEAAIAAAQSQAATQCGSNITFHRTNLKDGQVERALSDRRAKTVCVYARFFLHAITDEEENALIDALDQACEAGDIVAVEYRTIADQDRIKFAEPHFRRYCDAAALDAKMEKCHFTKRYGIEGIGFAKYKTEDAVVARAIFEKLP